MSDANAIAESAERERSIKEAAEKLIESERALSDARARCDVTALAIVEHVAAIVAYEVLPGEICGSGLVRAPPGWNNARQRLIYLDSSAALALEAFKIAEQAVAAWRSAYESSLALQIRGES